MNYELAKKLKDAGFPIIEHPDRAPELREYGIQVGSSDRLGIVYIPTLEELIDACGEEFMALVYDAERMWSAIAKGKKLHLSININPQTGQDKRCSTPLEAVARLWLALHAPEVTKEV